MTLPTITANGNLTSDPDLRFTTSGKAVATFTIACNDRRKNLASGEWEDGDVTWLGCELWNDAAEQAAEQSRKGQRVQVVGRLRQRQWEAKDGTKRSTYEVVQASVHVALKRQPKPDTQPFTPTQEVAPF